MEGTEQLRLYVLVIAQNIEAIKARLRERHAGEVDHDVVRQIPSLRMLGVNGSRGQVEDDGLLQNRVPVLIAAVNLDLVRSLRFEPAGEKAQHHGATERGRELLAPQRVDAGAEDVDKPVGRTLGCVGEQRPVEPQLRDLTTSPPFITKGC